MSKSTLRPGLTQSLYPQKMDAWPDFLESKIRQFGQAFKFQFQRQRYTVSHIVKRVARYENGISDISDETLKKHLHLLKGRLLKEGLQDELIYLSFSIIREAAMRVLGMRHFDVQLLGGWVMINGMIAEMETGQGKTLAATLPACTAALAGIPVHVVTANDYLAERDEQILRPLYQWLGISSASVVDGMETEPRTKAYQCGIVHSTSQQIAFDYLRDRMAMGDDIGKMQIQFKQIQHRHQQKPSPFLLRGLCFTIIDEADSLLIDEAKTPLIISKTRQSDEQNQIYYDALFLASSLKESVDYVVDEKYQEVKLTAVGEVTLATLAENLDQYWQRKRQRNVMTTMALKARNLFHRDKHYLVRDNAVTIIDLLTGRVMPDRSWEHGLHQLVEAKEGCEISGERDPLARIGYQKFFKRYLRLAGMSGTVSEVAGELNSVYGLRVKKVPTHKPSRRIMHAERIYKNNEQKSQAFISGVTKVHQQGRPILIGTQSVADSEDVSDLLSKNNLPHQVLNAQQDSQEAEIIAVAGQLNGITVATNMAGRGTDISLGEGVTDLGGLHVISTDRNDARRIDRQLYGRCARQGDPGSAEGYMSLEDSNIVDYYPSFILKLLALTTLKNRPLPKWLGRIILSLPQKQMESRHFKLRHLLMKQDKNQAKLMAFTGRME
ncbi:MAG: DEAD/DEAH box helicase [Methylophagaceae bacterium]